MNTPIPQLPNALASLAWFAPVDLAVKSMLILAVAGAANPLMWVASRRIALESEGACDDLVLGSEARPSDYAEHLLAIATGLKEGRLLSTAAVAMARSSRLKARLVGILDGRRNRKRLTMARVAMLGSLLTAVILPVAAMRSNSAIPWAQQRGWASQDVQPAEPALVKLLDSADPDIRVAAASALSECVDPALATSVVKLAREANTKLHEAAFALAMKLPDDAFKKARGDLLPLLNSRTHSVELAAIRCFAARKDVEAAPAILKALKSDSADPGDAVTIMQALRALAGSTFQYDMHNRGPKQNAAALRKIEVALRERRADAPPQNTMLFNKKYAAVAVQTQQDVQFVLVHVGSLSRGMQDWTQTERDTKAWGFTGDVALLDVEQTQAAGHTLDKRKITVKYTSSKPDTLYLDGKPYALNTSGRVFILREKGEPMQVAGALQLRTMDDLEKLGALAEAETRKNVAPIGEKRGANEGAAQTAKEGELSESQPAQPQTQATTKAAVEPPKYVDFSGTVVEDATGKPVPNFSVQGGQVDEKDPAKIKWGYTLQYTNSPNPTARFSSRVDWAGGWRSRIVADGYIGEPIMLELPEHKGRSFERLVIRLKRGRKVSGHLLDHTGKPIADAGMFVVGNPPVNLTGGKAMALEGGMHEDNKAVRIATDANGAFTVTGVAEDRHHIAVTCPAMDLWVVEVPKAGGNIEDLTIRLPEPGKLVVHYDIPGAPDKAEIFLQYHTWDLFKDAGVSNQHYAPIVQHNELVLNKLAPGTYAIDRTKNPGIAYKEARTLLDRREITIESGKTTTLDFVRNTGAPITGHIVGLDQGEVAKAQPTRVVVRVVPIKEDQWRSVVFDDITMEPGGKPIQGDFVTEQMTPGPYKIRVQIFVPEKDVQTFNTGIVPPAFVGEVIVTVPEAGKPEAAKISLKGWENADGI